MLGPIALGQSKAGFRTVMSFVIVNSRRVLMRMMIMVSVLVDVNHFCGRLLQLYVRTCRVTGVRFS